MTTPKPGRTSAALLAAFAFGLLILEFWSDQTRSAREQADRQAAAQRNAQWERDNPVEAAALVAKFQRAELRREHLFRDMAICRERASSAESMEKCFKEAQRRDALQCLQSQDWEYCEHTSR